MWKKIFSAVLISSLLFACNHTEQKANVESNQLRQGFNQISVYDLKKKFDNHESFTFILASSTCSHCQSLKKEMKSVNSSIPFFEVSFPVQGETKSFVLEYLSEFDSTPTTIKVVDGKVVDSLVGSVGIDKIEEFANN